MKFTLMHILISGPDYRNEHLVRLWQVNTHAGKWRFYLTDTAKPHGLWIFQDLEIARRQICVHCQLPYAPLPSDFFWYRSKTLGGITIYQIRSWSKERARWP